MTDYFALLDFPRRPWLDAEEVKRTFHGATRIAHPDVHAGQTGADDTFTELNEAYRILRDPKLRLQHFLALEQTADFAASANMSGDLEDLFPLISETCQQADLLLDRRAGATNALTRSLVTREGAQLQPKVKELLGRLRQIQDQAITQLKNLSPSGGRNAPLDFHQLRTISVEMTFVTRWLTQLEEKSFALSAA